MELDTTQVANAYMRTLEAQVQSLMVEKALIEAKLRVALEQLALNATRPKCETDCGTEGCPCKQ